MRTPHPDDQVLIAPRSTPTGFGLLWEGDTGQVRPLSPCCGAYMDQKDYRNQVVLCAACNADLGKKTFEGGSTTWLAFDIAEPHAVSSWTRWLSNLTGWEDVEVVVST